MNKKSSIINFEVHDTLNPKLWEGLNLKPKIRAALLKICSMFIDFLDVKKVKIDDITIKGSNVNYNYSNDYSDLDLHVIIPFDEIDKDVELVENLMLSKKSLWNSNHQIFIKNINVELYVENTGKSVRKNSSSYSLMNDKWLIKPSKENIKPDIHSALDKAKVCIKLIKKAIKSQDLKVLENTKEKIFNMREAGLSKEGEWSTENLAFKILRRAGYIEQFFDAKAAALDKELSLKEMYLEIVSVDLPPPSPPPSPPAIIQHVDKPKQKKKEHQFDVNKAILVATLMGEAGDQGEIGLQAVMNVIQNRGEKSKKDFNHLMDVALKNKQFSMWNGIGRTPKSLIKHVSELKHSGKWNNSIWNQAISVVQKAEKNQLPDVTDGATHYHTKAVHPDWSHNKTPSVVIGDHKFYNNV